MTESVRHSCNHSDAHVASSSPPARILQGGRVTGEQRHPLPEGVHANVSEDDVGRVPRTALHLQAHDSEHPHGIQ